jgi:2-keto-4-pentenoate hydratase
LAEPEIAVHIGREIPAGGDVPSLRAAISAIGPAIELVDLHPPPEEVAIALEGNLFQRNVVLGPADKSRAGGRLEALRLQVMRNGEQVAETGDMEANTGAIFDIVRHVADTLDHFGERLRAGEIVICGSVVTPLKIDSATREIVSRLVGTGEVAVRFGTA